MVLSPLFRVTRYRLFPAGCHVPLYMNPGWFAKVSCVVLSRSNTILNWYACPGLLHAPTMGSRESEAGRERDDDIERALGVAEGARTGTSAVPAPMHPAVRITPIQRTASQTGPAARRFRSGCSCGLVIPGSFLPEEA